MPILYSIDMDLDRYIDIYVYISTYYVCIHSMCVYM